MFYFLILISLFINNSITNAFECNHDEVYYEDSCYKLVKLENFLNNASCSKINSNESNEIFLNQCIAYLHKVINRLNKIYTNNLRLNDLYQFGFLDHKLRKATWEKIIKIYQRQTHENFNIFNNFYYYNNNHYVENQPSDDEHPNVMMHGSSSGTKCISGQKIHSSNESFSFYYDDCNKELPFICIKPYDSNIFSEDYELNDRCSYFDKTEPGGNWFECDKLSDDQTINLSKSHKCCMYNIKWRENFYDANKLCYKFDSVVFSLRLKGYKVILEKYATFLSINYVDPKYLKESDFFAFWTSCNSKVIDPDTLKNNEKFQCIQTNPMALMTSSILEHNDIKGIKINVLKVLFNQTVKNFYNLTFINLLLSELKNKTINDENIKLCNQENFATYSNKTISSSNKTMIKLNSEDSLNSCLFKIYNMFDFNNVYLGRRKSISYKIQTKTVRSNKYSLANDSKCFHYSEMNDKYYLSIPIMNICYHFTIIDLKKMNNLSINYIQSLNYSFEPNFDIELNEISHEISTIILNTIGIADFNECYSNSSISNHSVLITKYLCFNLISLIKFINKNDNYLNTLTTHLVNSNIVIRLHSFSYIKTVLHLTCNDKAFKLSETIRQCSKFDDNKYCSFVCPSNCNNPSEIWQFKTNQFAYLNISSICYAAFHSNSLKLNRTEGKLYLGAINKDNKRLFVKNNGIYSNIWPPVYLKDNSLMKFISPNTGFSFASNDKEITEKNNYGEEILLVVKAAYSYNASLFGDKFDIDAVLHSANNYKFSNFNMKNLIKSEHKVALNTSLNNKSTILTLKSDELFSLNNYFQLTFNLNFDKVASIKFPINFINQIEKTQNEQIIRLVVNKITKTVKISYKSKNKTKIICKWYFNNQDSGISCFNSLSLSLNSISNIKDIQNEFNIIYPNFFNEFKTFTRVFLSDNKPNSCKNGGILSGSNSSNCLCLPGFSGNHCEKICNQSYYGTNCQYNCLQNDCKGYLICNIDPIGCSCASGYKGFKCDEPCSSDLWGPNCIFKCSNCEICNSFTGKCDDVTISDSSLKLILMWLLTFFLILLFAFFTKIIDERAEQNDDYLFMKPIELDQILIKTKLDF